MKASWARGLLLIFVSSCSPQGEADLTPAERSSIASELSQRLERDQHYRSFDPATADDTVRRRVMREAASNDSANLDYIRQLVDRVGWPDAGRFGEEAARAAFILVQHADRDPAFQVRMLPDLRAAVQRGEASPTHLAFLIDRLRVKQGLPQVYGTQYNVATDSAGRAIARSDGRLEYLLPVVEDPDRIDERRAEVGLGPWIEYERQMAASQRRDAAARPLPDTTRR